ncbi:MAG: glycine cleavage system protein H [Thermoanaerobaculia bacterium]|nr:glycine cleavage system protein H [Thermoanaerobaculia bacterium]
MVALFVIITFAIMLLVDHLILRQPIVVAEENPAADAKRPRSLPAFVSGFDVPENVSYHPGHMWALAETPELVRIGADDFAAKIAGKVDRIDLPTRGQWIRQGQKVITMQRGGRTIDLVSPIEGEIVDVNTDAANTMATAPYGAGWLLKVNSPDAKINFRNLLTGKLARRWMEDAATRLRAMMPAPAGAYAQDGGVAAGDLITQISDEAWPKVSREFFLNA